jgi:hypothetical protein
MDSHELKWLICLILIAVVIYLHRSNFSCNSAQGRLPAEGYLY